MSIYIERDLAALDMIWHRGGRSERWWADDGRALADEVASRDAGEPPKHEFGGCGGCRSASRLRGL